MVARAKRKVEPRGALVAGSPLPSLPVQVFAEDFSLLLRFRRMRLTRSQIRVLS